MASSCATFLHACSSLALGQRRASAPRASTSRHRVRARAAPPAGGPDDASEGEWNPARGPPGAERDRYRAPTEYDYDYAPPSQRGGGGPWESARGAPPGGGRGLGQGGDGGGGGGNNAVTNFLIAGAFVVGMGAGVAFDTSVNLEPSNVASRDILDRQTPSSEVCMANGASAMVFDQRVFLSLNPFNMYVAQPEVKPGCVLRRSNWNVLERNQLVDETMEKDCKRGMNTFAFVGDLDKSGGVVRVSLGGGGESIHEGSEKGCLGRRRTAAAEPREQVVPMIRCGFGLTWSFVEPIYELSSSAVALRERPV